MNERRGRMIRLKPETRISYRCSPSERRAKTTDPGHAPCRQTRQQRRLLGNRPTLPGFFDFDPTWELFPSSKGGSEFQVQDEDEDGPEEAEETELRQPGTKGLRAKANPKPYMTLVSRAQGRGRGQARAHGDDDNDDDEEEAEDQVFSDTGVRFGGETGLKPHVTLVSLDRRNVTRTTSERRQRRRRTTKRRRRTRRGSQEDKDPRQARSRIRLGRKCQLD